MSGRQSRGRRQEAVNAAKASVLVGEEESLPNHFDERQQRIYEKYGTA